MGQVFYIKLDKSGYVRDCISYPYEGYQEIVYDDVLPLGVIGGYYKWGNGDFVFDRARKGELDMITNDISVAALELRLQQAEQDNKALAIEGEATQEALAEVHGKLITSEETLIEAQIATAEMHADVLASKEEAALAKADLEKVKTDLATAQEESIANQLAMVEMHEKLIASEGANAEAQLAVAEMHADVLEAKENAAATELAMAEMHAEILDLKSKLETKSETPVEEEAPATPEGGE